MLRRKLMPSPTHPIAIHKFGGAALAGASAIAHVGALLAKPSAERRVVVTSALQGVTDALLRAVQCATEGDARGAEAIVRELSQLHDTVAQALVTGEERVGLDRALTSLTETLIDNVAALAPPATDRAQRRDAVLAHGERAAAQIVGAMLRANGTPSVVIDATHLIETDGRHGNAAPDLARSEVAARSALLPPLEQDLFVVVPGYIGMGHGGQVVTLGRGGSDLTATVLGRALAARSVTLWKDVPGVMTADPRLVHGARVVPFLDVREASELAYYGAKVLHPRTLMPLLGGTTLRLRPFADLSAHGTSIIAGRSVKGAPVRAISGMPDQAMITVSGSGMLGIPGVAARVFGALAHAHVSVSLISQASSEQSICFTIPGNRADEITAYLRQDLREELARHEIEDITVQSGLTTIAVVGSGMAHMPGIAARVFGAVADASVNVVAIAQGATERNISFVVDDRQGGEAVRAVHAAFRLDKVGGGRVASKADAADVIILGVGRVGGELVAQIQSLSSREAPRLRIIGLIDRSGFLYNRRGLTGRQLELALREKQSGGELERAPGGKRASAEAAVAFMTSHAMVRPVLVDVASGDTSEALTTALDHGLDLVLANKVPLASSSAISKRILGARERGRRVLHEATVGAGLPVIDTLQQLVASGDRVEAIDCSPSGTMGFVFSELGRGRAFSDVVRQAMSLGYTEPDPRDDLSGIDVARKGLILSRMLGYAGEMQDVEIESLIPESLGAVSRDEFLAALPESDASWAAAVEDARSNNAVLRYRVRVTRGGVRAGLARVALGSPLASLDGTDNLFVFMTKRYRQRPLVVSGPGAGAVVTAAGVLGDVLRIVSA
jgi:aspartokinase/homoserine dehydrogenase 1